MRVAIYNGNLQPTTFVFRLAQAVSDKHKVYLVGKANKIAKYKKDDITFLPSDHGNKYILLLQFLFEFFRIFITRPKDFFQFTEILKKSKKTRSTRIKQFLIWSKLRRYKIDTIHIQWASHINLFEELLDYKYFEIIVSLRGRLINITPLSDSKIKTLYQRTFPRVHKFHAVTEDIKHQAMKYGAKEDKISVIYSGIELSLFLKYTKTSFKIGETLNIISVGRQHWKKGYNYALNAIKQLSDMGIKVSYTIIGAAESEELIYLASYLDIKDNVNLTHKCNFNNVLEEMQKADVLLLPSVSEGLANVVIEAMSLKLPVISTDAVGMPELVVHKHTGLLYENRNVNDLVDKIIHFKSLNEQEIEELVSNGYNAILDRHSWEIFKRNFNLFYDDLN